jgi:hypothetical protein
VIFETLTEDYMKSGSLNLLEPSGPLKACNGFALQKTMKNVSTLKMEGILFSENSVNLYKTVKAVPL